MSISVPKTGSKTDQFMISANIHTTNFAKEGNKEVRLAYRDVNVINWPEPKKSAYKKGMCYGKVYHPADRFALINMLRHGNPNQYLSAIKTLGNIGGKCNLWTVPLLIPKLKSKSASIRAAAAISLGKTSGKGIAEVTRLLRDRDVTVRIAAAKALGEFKYGYVGSASALAKALRVSKNKVERDALVTALRVVVNDEGYLFGPIAKSRVVMRLLHGAVPAIIKTLEQGQSSARISAALILGMLKDKRGVGLLLKALGDKDQRVRKIASEALVKIGKPAVPGLKKLMQSKNPQVKEMAKKTWVRIP